MFASACLIVYYTCNLGPIMCIVMFRENTRLESTGTSPGIWNLDFVLWTVDFFHGLRMTQDYQLDISRPIIKTLKTFL